MKRLVGASGLALLLMAIVSSNAAMVAAQDAGTPGPPATPMVAPQGAGDPGPPATTTSGGSVERSVDVDKADGTRSWSWLGWPTMVGSIMFGNYWAIRRFQTSLLKARLAKFTSGSEVRSLDASPLVQSSSGRLPSGVLLLALTASMSFSLAALYDYPSQISNLHPWIDVVPWVWYLVGTFLIGLLSESRGVGVIPILGHVFGLLLWHFTPGQSVSALFYDVGWLGFLLGPVAFWALSLYLIFRLGRAFRRPFS